MAKTGRNEACPCGSGKKYKHCCLNGGISTNNIILDFNNQSINHPPSYIPQNIDQAKQNLTQEIDYDDRYIGYSPEIYAQLLENFAGKYNSKLQKSLLGLSPKQMVILIDGTSSIDYYKNNSNPILNIKSKNIQTDISKLEIIKVLKLVLNEYYNNSGKVKITQKGNFNLKLINKIRKEIFNESDTDIKAIKYTEKDLCLVWMAHRMLRSNKFVEENTSCSHFTKKVFDFLEKEKSDLDHALWILTFESHIFKTPWDELFSITNALDGKIAFLQIIKMICFRILHRLDSMKKSEWIKIEKIIEVFKNIYPEVVESCNINEYLNFDFLFKILFLSSVCNPIGLIEYNKDKNLKNDSKEIRCTDLFREVFNWKI